jgi:hypothetical protein
LVQPLPDGLKVGANEDAGLRFFIGGSRRYLSGTWGKGAFTEWKESRAAADLIREAKRRGKRVHAGRVNGLKRLRHFSDLGVDTADASSLSMYADTWIPRSADRLGQDTSFPGHDLTAFNHAARPSTKSHSDPQLDTDATPTHRQITIVLQVYHNAIGYGCEFAVLNDPTPFPDHGNRCTTASNQGPAENRIRTPSQIAHPRV